MKTKTPRKLSLVKFDFKTLPKKYHSDYPFRPEDRLIFLGEIPNMMGHCVLAKEDGTITSGWHTDNFVELTEDEL